MVPLNVPQPFDFPLIGAKVDLKYGGIVSLRQTLIRTFGRDILKFERFSLEELAKNVTSVLNILNISLP